MAYSQQPLISCFSRGSVIGQVSKPRHIETVISNLFVFDDIAYKLYKNDSEYYNASIRDISLKHNRFEFTRKDFEWNRALSPTIYLDLMGVRIENDQALLCPASDDVDDLVIVMKRIETSDIFFEKLICEEISAEDCRSLGGQLAGSLEQIRKEAITGYDYFEVSKRRIEDVRQWLKMVPENVSESEAAEYCDFLERFREVRESLFRERLSKELARTGDIHSHNAVVTDGTLLLMDTYPPKEEWQIEYEFLPLYRLGADIWGLSGNKECFDAFADGYAKETGREIDHDLDAYFIIYAASLMVPYFYMLAGNDPTKMEAAHRMHAFLREYYKSAAQLVH